MKEFTTFEEFEKHYFPKDYERKKIEKMTLREYGEYLAEKALENIKKSLVER